MTVLDAIKAASVMAGLLAQGEELPAAEVEYGLSRLNDMIDIWSIDRLAIPRRERLGPYPLVVGTSSYLIGPGVTWDAAVRPMWIDAAGLIDVLVGDDLELPMKILTIKEYARIPIKTLRSTLPRSLFYDKTYLNGAGTINIYPTPDEANQIVIYAPIAVQEFINTTDTLALPPGYRMAIISNLAVLLVLGTDDVDSAVASLANASYAAIKSGNVEAHMDPMVCDNGMLFRGSGHFNWLTGETS